VVGRFIETLLGGRSASCCFMRLAWRPHALYEMAKVVEVLKGELKA